MAPLGISLYPGAYGQGGQTPLRYSQAVELGKRAEEAGFDGVFVVEAGMLINDALATAQAIALATQRITVGTGIAHVDYRHPALLGASAVAIDELSGGRFVLGLGTSSSQMSQALGIPWQESRLALRETARVLRQVFSGEQRPAPLGPYWPVKHSVPIHFAALALETVELAGEIADGVMLYLATTERYQQAKKRLERGAHKAGRNPSDPLVTLLIPTFLSDDLESARAAARPFLGFALGLPLYRKLFRRSGFAQEMDDVEKALELDDQAGVASSLSDNLLDAVCLVGPVSRCQEHLAGFREAGIDYPIIAPQPVGEDALTAGRRLIGAFTQ